MHHDAPAWLLWAEAAVVLAALGADRIRTWLEDRRNRNAGRSPLDEPEETHG